MAPYRIPNYSLFQLMSIERKDPYAQKIWIIRFKDNLVQRPTYGAFES